MLRTSTIGFGLWLTLLLGLSGCLKSEAPGESSGQFPASAAADSAAAGRPLQEANAGAAGLQFGAAAVAAAPAATNRKIIYSASIELVVEDFTGVPDRVVALVKQFEGYVADSRLSGASGKSRSGTWKVRVPVERFESFVNSAKGLGELVSVGTDSQDVSEEYYDVEARVRNKTKEEERLIKLLEERPGKLEDVIAIERELSRVREEIERMQGRMRVLTDLTSLTTVTLTINEIKNYEPPQAPTLATRIRRAFGGSIDAMQDLGEGLLVAAAALVPWLPLLALLGIAFFWLARKGIRKVRAFLWPESSLLN